MEKKITIEKLSLPKGLTLSVEGNAVTVKGTLGEIKRMIEDPLIRLKLEDTTLNIICEGNTKRERRKIGTWKAHISNMFKGVQEGHSYKMKVCSGHFPMNITVSEKEFVVNNFLGEKVPRKVNIRPGVKVTLEGDIVTVESLNKELAGQTAADIEQLCRITGRDSRIFQDGIWIFEKDGKVVR